MSKFANFVPDPERDKEDTLNAERLIKSLKKTYIRVANCCAETDMNGYTYTHALVSEKGIISCTECGQELEVIKDGYAKRKVPDDQTYVIIGSIGHDPILMVFSTYNDAREWAEGVEGNFEIRSCKGIDYDKFELNEDVLFEVVDEEEGDSSIDEQSAEYVPHREGDE